ncbi:unnamed protein product [Anisakis simplex]|uniref:Protein NATD1 n=1 Tax=Anisakis simplex TaxID=6269 RepID=A0A0M3JSJ3_ANISI|nr:unnamed protein product [Anisakis simplex]
MSSRAIGYTVEHAADALFFYVKVNGSRSILEYRCLPNNVLDLYHTEVPPILRGKGIAKVLCQAAFKYAKDQNLRVLPTCSYVAKYSKKFATDDEKSLLVCREKLKRV